MEWEEAPRTNSEEAAEVQNREVYLAIPTTSPPSGDGYPLPPKEVHHLLGSSHWCKALPFIEIKLSAHIIPHSTPWTTENMFPPSLITALQVLDLPLPGRGHIGQPDTFFTKITQNNRLSNLWPMTRVICSHCYGSMSLPSSSERFQGRFIGCFIYYYYISSS